MMISTMEYLKFLKTFTFQAFPFNFAINALFSFLISTKSAEIFSKLSSTFDRLACSICKKIELKQTFH